MTKEIRKVYAVVGIKSLAFLFLGLLFLLATTAYGASPSSVVGTRWACKSSQANKADKGEILEFFKDKTYQMSLLNGKWVLLDDGRIKMDFTSFGMNQIFFAKIEGNRLNLNLSSGKLDCIRAK